MLVTIISLLSFFFLFLSSVPAHSAVFTVSSGDVTGLIAAINAANSNGQENTINLEPGTYTLTAIDSGTLGNGNGLPIITSAMTITGAGRVATIIERDANAPIFRILRVGEAGVTLQRLTLRGGVTAGGGGAIANGGTLTLIDCAISGNRGFGFSGSGGGISNSGTLTVIDSTLSGNSAQAGGGIDNGGTATISRTTFEGNVGALGIPGGGGLYNSVGANATITDSTFVRNSGSELGGGVHNAGGSVTLTNTTFAQNGATVAGGGLLTDGLASLRNTTFAENTVGLFGGRPGSGGGISGANIDMENTILARNELVGFGERSPSDCNGTVTSLGHNLLGDLTGCTITLQPTDLTGDPDLGTFIDSGAPGNGRFPLLAGSAAIDAGNDAVCPPTDQLVTPRNGFCDIGAIEFYPVVNDLMAVGNVSTDFDATPVPGGPAGTFSITAEFTNTSNQAIVNPFVEVVELSGGNLLLDADGGAGGVGARLTLPDSATTGFQPGASSTFEFLIGLQQREPFTFFVNMLGEPGASSPSVSMQWKSQSSSR